ncbi:TetR family transcriptional regulator [Trichococcus patagoniensis]|uniref:TetR family transcriptional regulator n=1 Tax=Trichococcus patagoniensis TaxID=382641 RepID=A0A2T5IKE6_9LACT|nr:TetR/AcrR family transcriptional regulator [Trichococcus patagoniensis]PTQ84294.1 TetR family transcriptional regulator [Trichococcus patagoniensis]
MKKTDRRVAKSQTAIKTALIELMSEKDFDSITIQDIADQADVNRGTIYHHYLDKFDLLDKIMEEHMNTISSFCDGVTIDYKKFILHSLMYFQENHLFFSTMLASEGARYFRCRFLAFNIKEFEKSMDPSINSPDKEIQVHFIANAYVGIVEWWVTNEMPLTANQVSAKVGKLLDNIVNKSLE